VAGGYLPALLSIHISYQLSLDIEWKPGELDGSYARLEADDPTARRYAGV